MAATKARTYQPQKTRAAIIKSGLKLFGSRGYHGTSVGDIATAAKITKGAFYHHFKSKEKLLVLIHEEYADYQYKAMQAAMSDTLSSAQQLRVLITCIVEAVGRYKPNVTVYFQERRYLTKSNLAKANRQRNELENAFMNVVEQGIASGEFRQDLDPRVACLGILGMCARTYQWYSPRGRLSASDVADNFSSMLVDGILA
jgi:AcrR family transcriptional regulator